ncbi:MAG: UV DNA damage repair endonuclease UvsE [Bacilli bacterium]|nr:UV DNA damage repair endonuclease UvsE [Bacilli bacterium]MDD4608337.1 UV DNA damage repair endonuclease UvsE [Bacilli bacterium]
MNIGYACLTIGDKSIKYKSCKLKNATEKRIATIIEHNLNSLEKAIEYNHINNIKLFRISSDIIPFGSKEVISKSFEKDFKKKFKEIGNKIKKYNIRVSMHPGQYTVLNSINNDVVKNSIADLEYHTKVLEALGTNTSSKIVLHIGGVYGDKKESINRFIQNYKKLDKRIKKRIVIENDDKSYDINDVLNISKKINCPVVFDVLHNKINCYDESKDNLYWIILCLKTWKKKDGIPKIHYSEQDENKKIGSHSLTINTEEFMNFYYQVKHLKLDIMLEVKDKDISAIKCINRINDII